MVFVVGVAAALLLGLGYVLQQRVASQMPLTDLLTVRLLLDVMRRRLWWGGIGCMVIGELLAGLSLQLATVAVVEPLLSTNLLFALGFAALLARQRLHWEELLGALLLSAALGVFIAVGDPRGSPGSARGGAVIALAIGVLVGVVAVLVGFGKTRGLVGESVLLALAAGLMYGLQDVATRAVLVRVGDHGIVAVPADLWTYVVLGSAVLGIVLSQSAFRAARLNCSLPPIAAGEPIAGIALGVLLLGDLLSFSVLGLTVESLCLVAMVAGVALIGRSRNLASDCLPVSPAPASRADPP